jgi:4'-phosphopantetheinyl transferase EntD
MKFALIPVLHISSILFSEKSGLFPATYPSSLGSIIFTDCVAMSLAVHKFSYRVIVSSVQIKSDCVSRLDAALL